MLYNYFYYAIMQSRKSYYNFYPEKECFKVKDRKRQKEELNLLFYKRLICKYM